MCSFDFQSITFYEKAKGGNWRGPNYFCAGSSVFRKDDYQVKKISSVCIEETVLKLKSQFRNFSSEVEICPNISVSLETERKS